MKMIRRLGVVAVLAVCTIGAMAQQYSSKDVFTNTVILTNATAVAVTTNGTAVTLTRYSECFLDVSFKNMSAGTVGDNPTITCALGADGTNYCTTGPGYMTAAITHNGATAVRWGTNVVAGSAGYLQVTIAGSTNTITTNVVVKAYLKPRRSG